MKSDNTSSLFSNDKPASSAKLVLTEYRLAVTFNTLLIICVHVQNAVTFNN